MTYPPQQPGSQGPGQPYQQQPGQPYPQQPYQQQAGGYPQQPYQQPGGYPQQPGVYPQQPGYQAPPPAPAKKGMGTGKILLMVVGGLVALCCVGGVVSVAVNSGTSTSSTSGTTANTNAGANANAGAALTTAGAAAPAGAAPHAKPGQPARDGKFEFVVQKVDCGKTQVGDQYLNKTAQGQFCLVTVSVKNIGNEARTFDGGNQTAFGPGGVKYTNDTMAETYANKDTETFLNDINPGNQVTGVLVFDIAKGAKITALGLHDSMFSGGVTVDVS